jgi:hypothetical protein
MCLLYVSGLIGPGDRKSIQPIAGDFDLDAEFVSLHKEVRGDDAAEGAT